MAGIYLHIPFCKTRCIYCDFYSTTRSELKTRYVQALCRELAMRKEYLKGEDIETIYFGGGTPSQLEKEDFEQIFDTIREIKAMGKTILLVEQNALKALSVADNAYVLEQGRITKSGPGKELLKDPAIAEAYLGKAAR